MGAFGIEISDANSIFWGDIVLHGVVSKSSWFLICHYFLGPWNAFHLQGI